MRLYTISLGTFPLFFFSFLICFFCFCFVCKTIPYMYVTHSVTFTLDAFFKLLNNTWMYFEKWIFPRQIEYVHCQVSHYILIRSLSIIPFHNFAESRLKIYLSYYANSQYNNLTKSSSWLQHKNELNENFYMPGLLRAIWELKIPHDFYMFSKIIVFHSENYRIPTRFKCVTSNNDSKNLLYIYVYGNFNINW